MPMPSVAMHRRVEWIDTDASGYWHNTAPIRYVEEAELRLLEALELVGELYGHLPRAHLTIDYIRPMHFHDMVTVTLAVRTVGVSSVTYSFILDDISGTPVAIGEVVAVRIDGEGEPSEWTEKQKRLLRAGYTPDEP